MRGVEILIFKGRDLPINQIWQELKKRQLENKTTAVKKNKREYVIKKKGSQNGRDKRGLNFKRDERPIRAYGERESQILKWSIEVPDRKNGRGDNL